MRFIAFTLSLITLALAGFMGYLAFTYLFTTGYGLHPAIAAFCIASLFWCLYVFNRFPSLDDIECGEEECDITNDVFNKY